MDLAEQLDPEVWSDIMQRFFRILSHALSASRAFGASSPATHHGALRRADRARGPRSTRLLRRLHLNDTLRAYANEGCGSRAG